MWSVESTHFATKKRLGSVLWKISTIVLSRVGVGGKNLVYTVIECPFLLVYRRNQLFQKYSAAMTQDPR